MAQEWVKEWDMEELIVNHISKIADASPRWYEWGVGSCEALY